MDEPEGANQDDAPDTRQDSELRRLRAESLERPRAVTWPNCACSPLFDTVPQPTFTGVLKCVFVFLLLLSLLSNFLVGAPWNITPCPTQLLSPIVTDWKTNVLIVVFVAVIYVGVFLWKLKKTSGSASQRNEDVPTISASIQQV